MSSAQNSYFSLNYRIQYFQPLTTKFTTHIIKAITIPRITIDPMSSFFIAFSPIVILVLVIML